MKLARSFIAPLCGLALVLAGAAQSPAVAAKGGKPKGRTPVTSTVKIATYNSAAATRTDRAVADIIRLAAVSDVVALQEMGSAKRRSAVAASLLDCETCAFDGYMPVPAVPGSTPILWNSERFALKGSGTRQVTQDTYVGRAGAGPSTLRAKYINYVLLRDRTTSVKFYVLNNHAVPTVQGKGGGANRKHPKRLALYRQHMEGLKSMVNEFVRPNRAVFIAGDLNVNYRRDRIVKDRLFPYSNLGEVGVQASHAVLGEPSIGTHVLGSGNSGRLIDYVSYLRHQAVTPLAQQVHTGYSSDHRPLVVDFKLTSLRKFV
jgi:endonuclease/exonuclease/phosphatase family metal-dependent hydrolase